MPSDGCFAPILVQCSGVNTHVMATHTHMHAILTTAKRRNWPPPIHARDGHDAKSTQPHQYPIMLPAWSMRPCQAFASFCSATPT